MVWLDHVFEIKGLKQKYARILFFIDFLLSQMARMETILPY